MFLKKTQQFMLTLFKLLEGTDATRTVFVQPSLKANSAVVELTKKDLAEFYQCKLSYF